MHTYELKKKIWSENDFSIMGWHDSKIWGFLADTENFEFMIDLDYIFQWIHPRKGETYFKFWVAPVTMVFENAYDILLDIESRQGELEVADLHMVNERKTKNGRFDEHDFRFDCQEGEFKISATGFKMYVRKAPILQSRKALNYKLRGGINFSREYSSS
ncbi:hypothetical protein ACJJI5_03940 [Microbulbifer sp. EKSA008]|uniref:hypothetical protein n=1 Tax=unclassified Microbulbifer TaxID=2619833 RepID=UPI00403A5DC5